MSHTGFTYEEVMDPLDPIFHEKMRIRAKINTEFYRDVFACYPDDNILTLADYDKVLNAKST